MFAFWTELMWGVLIAAIILVAVYLLNRTAFNRIWSAASGQVGKAGRAVWSHDPIAVYQAEVDRSAEEIAEATRGLEQYRGLVARLQRQVENGDKEVARLTARIKVALQANDDNKATEYAVLLKKAEADLAENRGQLAEYQQSYENHLKKIKHAREKIAEAKSKAQSLDAQLKMSKAEAEIANLAQKVGIKGASLEGLGEIEDEIQRQIDTNRAKAQVARDLSSEGLADLEAEERLQKEEAKAAKKADREEMRAKQATRK